MSVVCEDKKNRRIRTKNMLLSQPRVMKYMVFSATNTTDAI